MFALARSATFATLTLLAGCNDVPSPTTATTVPADTPAATTPTPPPAPAGNLLRMRIDGKEWVADHDIFGAVHPTGYDRSIVIAGSLGPKDANEQAFNVVLNGIAAPGTVHATTDDPARHVVQIANLSPQRFLAGGLMLQHDVTFEVTRMQANPVMLEARFSGTLTANDDTVLTIEAGEFRYRE